MKSVLLRMMLHPYGPQDLLRLTKHLKAVSPSVSPFSLWLLRQCAAGGGAAHTLAQAHTARAAAAEQLGAAVDALFATHQEQVLYSGRAWVAWLHQLPTRHLVAFYIKVLGWPGAHGGQRAGGDTWAGGHMPAT